MHIRQNFISNINPAITLGVVLSKRMSWKDACGYWAGQFIGGIVAAAVLFLIIKVSGAPGAMGNPEGMGANGTANAGGPWGACLVELIATFIFVLVVLGTTDAKKGAGNFAGGAALKDVWVFIVAPLAGGALAVPVWKAVSE